ncbi:MAG: DUF2478 domain-containing protein [Paracoccaceae bacterium]
MKLAVVSSDIRGETDRLLSVTAAALRARGVRLSGATKVLVENAPGAHACDMDLQVWPEGPQVSITQSLGEGSEGCRLNPAGIAQAVAEVERRGEQPFDLFILNKFGPQESEGHGFCGSIGTALERGAPVLVGVGLACREAFDAFAGGLAETLPSDADAILEWCLHAIARRDGAGASATATDQPASPGAGKAQVL